MIYPIVRFGAVVLEKPAAAVEKFDEELRKLCADMFASMYAAQGVGLAAPRSEERRVGKECRSRWSPYH